MAQFENESLVSMERLGVLRNYKNINGEPAAVPGMFVDKYGIEYDAFGNKRYQGIPLYKNSGDLQPARYALDGELISIVDIDMSSDRIKIKFLELNDEYYAPKNYVRGLNIKKFKKSNQRQSSKTYIYHINPNVKPKHKLPKKQG